MEKMNGQTVDLEKTNIEKLKELFPEIVTDGKVDFSMLKNLLGGEIDESNEKYSFTWNGKSATIKNTLKPTTGTLIPCKDKSVDWDTTENLYIEGDNLEVLKILQKTYSKKIKMIYIDPPYNTGKDFVYKDNFVDSIANYKEITGQQQRANPDASGRFHTDWLNMMYARLMLAKNLLSDDGVIFISISDEEQKNLKNICDEIFGEENFCGDIIWNSTKSVTNTALISVSHTYNLVYFRNIEYFVENRSDFRLKDDGEGFDNPDNDPRGAWKADPFQVGGWRPNQQYEIVNPKTGKIYKPNPGCSWKNDYEKYQELVKDNRIVFGTTGESGPQRKRFIWEAKERGKVTKTWWDDVETTTNGTQLLKKIFDNISLFDNPKPVGLLKKMLELGSNQESIILDFFSGSATTAHAVMQLNAEDGGKRKYIMVQLPELCAEDSEAYKAGYKTICEIGEERIRRAGKKIKEENPSAENLDTGFKVFKLESTNIVPWDSAKKLEEQDLISLKETIKEGRKEEDVVYEIMLKYGVFDTPMKKQSILDKTIYSVGDNFMIICLDENITMEVVGEIAKMKPNCAVFKELGFKDDNEKMNATYTLERCKVEKILCI